MRPVRAHGASALEERRRQEVYEAMCAGNVRPLHAYLKDERENRLVCYEWSGGAGASCAVPFDTVAWRYAASTKLNPGQGAAELRSALSTLDTWKFRGAEVAHMSSPRVYARYCALRGRAAYDVVRKAQGNAAAGSVAAYAALMFGVAHVLEPSINSLDKMYNALGVCYAAHGERLLALNEDLGAACGALREAQAMFDLGGTGMRARLGVALQRNAIRLQPEVAPDPAKVVCPRTLGCQEPR